VIPDAAVEESVPMKISDEAVTAAIDALPYQAADYVDTDTMRAALEAAAPHMLAEAKAQALEEAADALVERGAYIRKMSADTGMYVTALAISDGNERAATWLRARADEIRK